MTWKKHFTKLANLSRLDLETNPGEPDPSRPAHAQIRWRPVSLTGVLWKGKADKY